MNYKKLFDTTVEPRTVQFPSDAAASSAAGDQDEGRIYIYTPEIELAVNVALATRRPLLLRGPSGSGKSSLAKNVAYIQGWRYYTAVISSRTQAQDLMWRFDNVLRLGDALDAKRQLGDTRSYLEPSVLWWAFDPVSAGRKGADSSAPVQLSDPSPWSHSADRAVVLIDEIDKADPDVPNNLLVPLGSFEFRIPEIDLHVRAATPPLVMITTNDERDLPNAFIRRCVVAVLSRPSQQRLREIAMAHFGPDKLGIYGPIASLLEQTAAARERRGQHAPSSAEYLDAIAACMELEIVPGENKEWAAVMTALFTKPRAGDEIRS
jgi:MoxR-like ATPase